MKPLEFDGDGLFPHGYDGWYDSDGLIWEPVLDIPRTAAKKLLEMAYVVQMGPDFSLSDYVGGSSRRDALHWLHVGAGQFVVYLVCGDKAFAVLNSCRRLTVVRESVDRLRAYVENLSYVSFREKRLLLALDTFKYDMCDQNLLERC